MKWLKLFESFEDYSQWGITPDDIKECLYEIEDEGWDVNVKFDKKMMSDMVNKENSEFEFDIVPCIEIKIIRYYNTYTNNIEESKELEKLKLSETYKDFMHHLLGVLQDGNLYIKEEKVEFIKSEEGGSQIFILILKND
jgi:hypothetical protein